MRRRMGGPREPLPIDVESAIKAMGADDLRGVVRDLLLELDDRSYARVTHSLVDRLAREGSGWAPRAVSADEVAETLAFVRAAERVGAADPPDVDEHLRRGFAAFLGKDYRNAYRIFGALLQPIARGDIDLGQHEMVDEVLGMNPSDCATQYVVSSYMISEPVHRAKAVHKAINDVRNVGSFWEPIREMERVAVESLPQLDAFLQEWRAIVAREAGNERADNWDSEKNRWLREVVLRLEGTEGLARLARSTRHPDHLRTWCEELVRAGDWKAAFAAFEEAASLVDEGAYERGELLDGVALAAQQLNRSDLPAHLERAWRGAPTMERLRRWLGSAPSSSAMGAHVAGALDACPKRSRRQRAFLHLLQGDFAAAAKLLEAAPGLGWSDGEHPGHLLFPLFEHLLEARKSSAPGAKTLALGGSDGGDLDVTLAAGNRPRLALPEIEHFLRQAGIEEIRSDLRSTVLAAMRRAAERRLSGVTESKRRRHYGHAAELVAICLACDPSPETVRWVDSLKAEYRRFPALRGEFDRRLESR